MSSEAHDKSISVFEAVAGRRSIRRFLSTAVPKEWIVEILAAASRAPSGVNAQPWRIHVVTGAARERLAQAVKSAADNDEVSLEYAYLPAVMKEPYLSRRRKVGHDLYALYGIDRQDEAARKAAMLRNFDFFGAPVGLFFTMERELSLGSWLDMGMFIQNVMVLARARGLDTCAQQAWCDYGAVVHRELRIPADHILLSGMALGYIDNDAPENSLVSERVLPHEFVEFHQA
jgi:nitroreductase